MAGRSDAPGEMFDVVVIGAGPAGASAARAAARAGVTVCMLERAELPRYKTCGGGLVGLAVDHAGIDLSGLVHASIDQLTVSLDGRLARTRRRPGRPMLSMVMRSEFDRALVHSACAAGAGLRTGVHVTGLREVTGPTAGPVPGPGGPDSNEVQAATAVTAVRGVRESRGSTEIRQTRDGCVVVTVRGGREIRARVVVGADGASGRTGAHVGVRCDQVDVGLEGEFPVSAPTARRWGGRMLLDWGPVPGSYAWLFPKSEVLTVGVIGSRADGDALRSYYGDLVRRLGLGSVTPLHDSGHLTRVRAAGSPLRRGRVLVAGDAAGLLDPWTREGISFALRSGRLAGEAAARAAVGDLSALAEYPRRIEAVLGPEMDAGRKLQAVYAHHPGLLHALLTCMPGTFGLFGRIVDGRTTVARQLRRPGVRAVTGALAR
ncbi:geranylgeranyl reductase family protein [Frankia sp. Cas4]|uniref:geranylgeranyl reductase family protein n=1 Tax=Frankia sp. Cas4 TaxID=3073927 RepID=UPI002AD54EF0|nr:geranylgeranyl reductase family protein [Frankia sp. Cas4]